MDDFWWALIITMFYIPFMFLWGFTLFDMMFRKDLHAWSKFLWALFVLFVPLIGVIVYYVARPRDYDAMAATGTNIYAQPGYNSMPQSSVAQSAQMPVNDMAVLSHMHDEGKLSDSEYESLRQRLSPA